MVNFSSFLGGNDTIRLGHGPLAAKLQTYGSLDPAEIQVLDEASSRQASFGDGNDIVTYGSTPTESCLLLDGFAARYKVISEGGRQITALHVPGDFVDLQSFLLQPMDHSIAAMSHCRVAYFPHTVLRQITETQPHLTRLLWHNTLVDGAIHREWLVAMGRLSATQHTGHLLCELYLRLEAVGLVKDQSYALPLTQAETSDALGLSHVHMNRSIQALRGEGLVVWNNGVVTINDFDALAEFAEFDPAYLGHGRKVH